MYKIVSFCLLLFLSLLLDIPIWPGDAGDVREYIEKEKRNRMCGKKELHELPYIEIRKFKPKDSPVDKVFGQTLGYRGLTKSRLQMGLFGEKNDKMRKISWPYPFNLVQGHGGQPEAVSDPCRKYSVRALVLSCPMTLRSDYWLGSLWKYTGVQRFGYQLGISLTIKWL